MQMSLRRPLVLKKDIKKEIKKQQINLPDLSNKFKQIFEICGDEIVSYLSKSDYLRLRSVCRVTFYIVQSYQIWDMMIIDNDEISSNSQATTNDSNIKESFLKSSFYSKVGKSRPSTQESIETEQWLVKPPNLGQQSSKLIFLKNKNKIEQNILNDEELKQIINLWTVNLTNLEKCLNIQKIQTDSFIQEITLWIDHIKLIEQFQKEFKMDHVGKILSFLKQKSIVDLGLDRKRKIIDDLLNKLLNNYDQKQQFVQLLLQLKPICQQILQVKLADFSQEIPQNLWPLIDNSQHLYINLFNIRKECFFMKLFQIIQKLFNIDLSWCSDFSNYELKINLMEQFLEFITTLLQKFQYHPKNELYYQQIEQYFIHFRKGIMDLIKMLKLNKKLYDTQRDNFQFIEFIQNYKQQTFNHFEEKQQWNSIYNSWKENYQNIKKKQQPEEQTIQEGISFGFFQTKMSWSIN